MGNRDKRVVHGMTVPKCCSIALVILMMMPLCTMAKDFGTRGQVFPIKEQDFRVFIQNRLAYMQQHGQLTAYEKAAKKRIAKHAYRPAPLHLGTQSDTEVTYVDPSIVLKRNITDQLGHVLVKAGTKVNPFKTVHLHEVLIFFNGDDATQGNWVLHHYQHYKWVKFILTGGDIRDAAKAFGRIYFDQYGHLTQKLHIKHVPAIAQQQGLKWKITTIGTKEF